jgi:hypothetical protein
MNYKQVLIHEDPIYNGKKSEYMSWDEVILKVNEKEKPKTPIVTKPSSQGKYDILSENDSLLYDITNELKEKFEFKGIMNNCSLPKLIDIFAKNMKLEEALDDNDDEDNVFEDDDNNC